jgi:C4-dicarboxylate-specific signal transduction histidine kinase/sensor domain CHASE-containing protein
MNIQRKTLLITGTALTVGILVLYLVLRSIVSFGFLRVEEKEAQDETRHVVDLIGDDVKSLERIARDYASWDETYRFLGDGNPGYIRDNLTLATLMNLQTNAMIFVRPDHSVLYARAMDLLKGASVPVSPALLQALAAAPDLTTHPTTHSRKAGIVALPEGPMLVASLPVLTNEDEGPVRGSLVAVRALDAGMIGRAERIIGVQVALRPFDEPSPPPDFGVARSVLAAGTGSFSRPIDANRFAGYAVLADIHGRPVYLVRAIIGREIWAQSRSTLRYSLLSLVIVSLIFSLATAITLKTLILARLRNLTTQVRSIGQAPCGEEARREIVMEGNDELSDLARVANQTFQALNRTEEALRVSNTALECRVGERTAELSAVLAQVRTLELFKDEIIRSMLDGLCTFNAAGHVTLLNPAGAAILGSPADPVGRPLAAVIGVEFAQRVLASFRAGTGAGEGTPTPHEFLLAAGAAGPLVLLYTVATMRGGNGNANVEGPTGILTFWDITKLRRAEEEVQRLERLAALGEISAQVAHELRNPLTAMYSTMQCLKPLLREQDSQMGQVILESMVRMETIIGSMGLLARETPLAIECLDLGPLVQESLALVTSTLHEQGVRVCPTFAPDPLWIDGDKDQLRQVVLNLLLNAAQAMTRGGELTVVLEGRGTAGAGTVVLSVEDTGPGVDPERVEKIFDPFYTTKERGMGLGLSISERIVRAHGGSLTFTNRPEGGAAFAVSLRWAAPPAPQAAS